MARKPRNEVFAPDEIAIVHVKKDRGDREIGETQHDPVSGKNFDHRKVWIEELMQSFAASSGIGLAILSSHFHLVLRSRPDVVATGDDTWDDTEVARRWTLLGPNRHQSDGAPAEPNEPELHTIRNSPDRVKEIRSRLSDVSWWMRLLCKRIAMRANKEEGEVGRFWQNRFKAVKILDEVSLGVAGLDSARSHRTRPDVPRRSGGHTTLQGAIRSFAARNARDRLDCAR